MSANRRAGSLAKSGAALGAPQQGVLVSGEPGDATPAIGFGPEQIRQGGDHGLGLIRRGQGGADRLHIDHLKNEFNTGVKGAAHSVRRAFDKIVVAEHVARIGILIAQGAGAAQRDHALNARILGVQPTAAQRGETRQARIARLQSQSNRTKASRTVQLRQQSLHEGVIAIRHQIAPMAAGDGVLGCARDVSTRAQRKDDAAIRINFEQQIGVRKGESKEPRY